MQRADQRSIEKLAFNFASKTFAYRRSAQGLSRAIPAIYSFIRKYLGKVIKADQCAQYVDDSGKAAIGFRTNHQQPSGHFPVLPESWLEINDV